MILAPEIIQNVLGMLSHGNWQLRILALNTVVDLGQYGEV
jgi:hypothetical protein